MQRDEAIVSLVLPPLEKSARLLRDFNYPEKADQIESILDDVKEDIE